MHRAPDPDLRGRVSSWAPYVLGGAAVALLFAVASTYRFAGSDSDTAVAAAQVSTTTAAVSVVSTAPTTTVTTAAPTTSAPVSTSPATTVSTRTTEPEGVAEPVGPHYGGVATVGVVGDLVSLNPLGTSGNSGPVAALTWAVTTGAIRMDPQTLQPAPVVIEALPTPDNGGLAVNEVGELVVRYTIRPDAVWADGTPITVDDFIRTHDVARGVIGRADLRDRYGGIVPGSVTGEGRSVEYRLRQPGLEWIALFDVLVPAHEVTATGFATSWNETMWSAGGPFQFVSSDPDRSSVRLIANERFWGRSADGGDPLPYLDGLEVRFYPTRGDLVDAVKAGEVDVASVGGDPATLTGLSRIEELLLDVQRGPAWEQIGFQFGPRRFDANPAPLTDDVEVRRAIAALVDRPALAAEVQGAFGRPLDSVVGLSWPDADEPAWSAIEDLDRAAATEYLTALVEASESPPVISFATTANDANREMLARRLVEALEPLGLVVDVSRTEPGAYFLDLVIPGSYEVAAWAWQASYGPWGVLDDMREHHITPWPDGTDFYQWRAGATDAFAQFQAALEQASGQVDVTVVGELIGQLEQHLFDDMVFIPLYAELNAAAVVVDRIGGFRHSPLPGGELASVAEWWTVETG